MPSRRSPSRGSTRDGDGKLGDRGAPAARQDQRRVAARIRLLHLPQRSTASEQTFALPTEYWLEHDGSRLTLFYTLPLDLPVGGRQGHDARDLRPGIFRRLRVPGRAAADAERTRRHGCTATYHPPKGLDDQTMAVLNSLPMRPARAAAGPRPRRRQPRRPLHHRLPGDRRGGGRAAAPDAPRPYRQEPVRHRDAGRRRRA